MAIEFNIYGKQIEPTQAGIQTINVLEPNDITNLATQNALNLVSNNLNTNFFRISGGNITGGVNIFGNLSASGDFFYANQRRNLFLSDNLISNAIYNVDTTTGSLTATLPSNPSLGDEIEFIDVMGLWGTNPFFIKSDFDKIEKTNNQLLKCDVKYGNFKLNYIDPQNYGWKITTFPNVVEFVPYESLVENLIAYWTFNLNITPTVGFYVMSGNAGWSYPTPAIDQYGVRLNENQRLLVQQNLWNVKAQPLSYSVSFWVRPNLLANTGQESVLMGSCFGSMGFYFNLGNVAENNFSDIFNQHITFSLATGSNYEYKHVSVPFVTTTNVWYHIVGTYNLDTQTAKLYVNGNLIGTTTNVLNNDCVNPSWAGFCLNGSPITNGLSEYGKTYDFDMVGFWERTLTDREVDALYSSPIDFQNLL